MYLINFLLGAFGFFAAGYLKKVRVIESHHGDYVTETLLFCFCFIMLSDCDFDMTFILYSIFFFLLHDIRLNIKVIKGVILLSIPLLLELLVYLENTKPQVLLYILFTLMTFLYLKEYTIDVYLFLHLTYVILYLFDYSSLVDLSMLVFKGPIAYICFLVVVIVLHLFAYNPAEYYRYHRKNRKSTGGIRPRKMLRPLTSIE